MRILTEISNVFWCEPLARSFERAKLPKMEFAEDPEGHISWLDVLLEGGIVLPPYDTKKPRALTILISGAPGSGKSSLALELAYRWAVRICERTSYGRAASRPGWNTLYVTSEVSLPWARAKAQAMGWPEVSSVFPEFDDKKDAKSRRAVENAVRDNDQGRVFVLETRDLDIESLRRIDPIPGAPVDSREVRDHLIELMLHLTASALGGVVHLAGVPGPLIRLVELFRRRPNEAHRGPEVVVYDSLDTLSLGAQKEALDWLDVLRSSGPRLIVMMLNSGPASQKWEHQADLVIECGAEKRTGSDYLVRTIEIKKARFQAHAWNAQQLKVYGPSSFRTGTKGEVDLQRRRGHPYREEGGVFIFPSIHFFLSRYKRESPQDRPGAISTSLDGLDELLSGGGNQDEGVKEPAKGLPRGRCTGFVGVRGGHKSHLGYRCILNRLVQEKNKNSRGLIVSLRDDEGTAEKTITRILREDLNSNRRLADFRNADQLEILYFPPGNITPEEMFHRIYLSLMRLKVSDLGADEPEREVTVLFNSLDQLSSRFPLCAGEAIFVPGIIETLSAEKVTSIFIGVEEPGQPEQQYGLLSMADLLIRFEQRRIETDLYLQRLGCPLSDERKAAITQEIGVFQFPVVTRVVRFAGGQAAGASGMLELVDGPLFAEDPRKPGLHFCQLKASDYSWDRQS